MFIVQNLSDFNYFQKFNKYKLKKLSYKPFFNSENLNFFVDNVFINEEQLLKSCPNMLKIISRKEINERDFGNLSILPNGDVFPNLFTESLGNIQTNSISDLIYKELKNSGNWLKTRSKVKPCKDCKYCFICPPISNYEYAINKHNLCHVMQ